MSLKCGLILLAVLALANSERARYDFYRVYKVNASNLNQLAFLKQMESSSDALIFLEGIHFVNKTVSVVVAPHKTPDFLKALDNNEIEYKLVEKNLQARLEEDNDDQIAARTNVYGWTSYHTLEDTYSWLQSLARSYPGIVTVIEGGQTYEKRAILGVKISYGNGRVNKSGIFLEAGIHAREWIAPATATYIINQLLTSDDPAIKLLSHNYDWYIFPHANPDGYVYTQTNNRLWRKTRQPHGSCFGADPNRNWGFYWNTVGSSSYPCSDTYAGPYEFSEIETESLANYITSLKGKIQLYLSLHAYSQFVLYPYGHTHQLPDNFRDYKRVFDVTVAAFSKRYGTKYTGGNIYDAIYPASGASVDWAYAKAGTRMSFCFELRPGPNSFFTGFQLPPRQIIPTGEETLDAVVAMVNEVNALGYFRK